jgi:hypothetical protein
MEAVGKEFAIGAHEDLAKWDCTEMYPMPEKMQSFTPGWLGSVSKIAN